MRRMHSCGVFGLDFRVLVERARDGIAVLDGHARYVFVNAAFERNAGLPAGCAKSLCELHGGTIHVHSDGPGRGSTFTVKLPLATRPLANDGGDGQRAAVRTNSGRRRILVVDDNIDAAQTLHDLLSELGHELAIAHDALAALDLAKSFKPSVALLDIGLPVMDGYELAGKLREQLGREALRLIAVTGYGQDDDRARARHAGFDHHLVKPITLEALMPLLDVDG